jgi:hypothetical protein
MLIEVDPKTAELIDRFRAEAAARQMTLDAYLQALVEPPGLAMPEVGADAEELERLLDEFSEPIAGVQPLPANFSRADIYFDHD